LSVIVCTHERPADLERCLDGLCELRDPVEVIVVDSGSRVPCGPQVDAYRDRIADLRYVYVERPGLSAARNAGSEVASGRIVAFVDDDAVPAPDWARAIAHAFREDDVGCVGGACRAAFAAPRPSWLSDRLLALAGVTRFGDRAREPRSSAEWPFGANMAFRREALEAAGPFSSALGRNGSSLLSGEDSDMVARVAAAGWRLWLEPSAVVAHRVSAERCRSGYYWRRLWWNGIGRAVDPSTRVTARLLAAVPIRLALWVAARDRVYLYRLAESAGYFAARLGAVRR
jgi:cellulose synthase/poly-beta-1,6-N-acetylglucosamine synthase-like glycosyltransferase